MVSGVNVHLVLIINTSTYDFIGPGTLYVRTFHPALIINTPGTEKVISEKAFHTQCRYYHPLKNQPRREVNPQPNLRIGG